MAQSYQGNQPQFPIPKNTVLAIVKQERLQNARGFRRGRLQPPVCRHDALSRRCCSSAPCG